MVPVDTKALTQFRQTDLYKEIKSLCGLPATSYPPSDCGRSLERGLQKREQGMAAYISCGSFSANQQRLIANMFVPNSKRKELLTTGDRVFVSKFSRDGKKMIIAGKNRLDCMLHLYDTSQNIYQPINRVRIDFMLGRVYDADFSPCGNLFVYSTWFDNYIMPFNGNSYINNPTRLSFEICHGGILSVRFSPCGKKVIAGCNNSCIYMCDIETRMVKKIRTHRHDLMSVNSLCYISDRDPNIIACGNEDGLIKMYDARCYNKKATSIFYGHTDGVTYLDPRNDGYYILSNSKDETIKIWDLRKPTVRSTEQMEHTQENVTWKYRCDPALFLNKASVKDPDVSVMTYRGHRVVETLVRSKFSPAHQTGQRYIYTGCSTGRIIIFDVLTGKMKENFQSHKRVVRDLDWHPWRSEIVSSSFDSYVNLNTFQSKAGIKRGISRTILRCKNEPLRRSRRLANQSVANNLCSGMKVEPEEPMRRW